MRRVFRLRAHQVRRVVHQGARQEQRQDAHGDVDEEDPSPGVVVGDPAAQGRADDRRHDDAHAVGGHGQALLGPRETLDQDRLARRLQRPAARPLEMRKNTSHPRLGARPHSERPHREEDHAGHVEPLAAEERREPPAQGQDDRVGDQVRRQDPRRLVDAGRQVRGDVRQGDVGDRAVEHLHEGRQHDRHGDDPGVDARPPDLGQVGGRCQAGPAGAHSRSTSGTTDIPGASQQSGSGGSSKTILTGIRWTILT